MRGSLFVVPFVVVGGCGRIAFDPSTEDGGREDGGSDGGLACPVVARCPDRVTEVGTAATVSTSIDVDHGLSSETCSIGADTAELVVVFTPNRAGRLTIDASPSSTGVYVQDRCCGGRELACGTGPITVQRTKGEDFVVIVEGAVGTQVLIEVALN